MPFNYAAMRLRADRMIARYGAPAKLRRNGIDRNCTVAEIAFTPRERLKLVNPNDRRVLVSAESLAQSPDLRDVLVMVDPVTSAEVELKIVSPPARLAPAGIVVFWDLTVRGGGH